MPVATGIEIYNADSPPVAARGATITHAELDDALNTSVAPLLRDDSGRQELENVLSGLATTTFETQNLQRVLDATREPEGWRVGEAIAEAFLTEHRRCSFPWPGGRDLKNPNASPAGTDLVGFQEDAVASQPYRFAFGEVKTSYDEAVPPTVVVGRHGVIEQIETLRDSSQTKDALVRYLGFHAPRQSWEPRYRSAASRYLRNPGDAALFGIIIRDTTPAPGDLAARVPRLAAGCPALTRIELRAIYLPAPIIQPRVPHISLADRAIAAMQS